MANEADTCRKSILPKLYSAGWTDDQINEQRTFTDGRIMVVGNKTSRQPQKRADYLLRYRPNVPIAVIEAKASYKLPAPEYPDSRRAVRGEFAYRGATYRMDVTDPVVEQSYLKQADGQYDIPHPVLCVSLSDLYEGYFYKLIAAVLYSERFT